MAVAELTLQTFLPKPFLSTKMAPAHQYWGLPIIVEKKLTWQAQVVGCDREQNRKKEEITAKKNKNISNEPEENRKTKG